MVAPAAKRVLNIIEIVVIVIIGAIILMLAFLSLTEYNPAAEEDISIQGQANGTISSNDAFTIVTWNTGYGGLSKESDFFMDGGSSVTSVSKEGVLENIENMQRKISEIGPDFIFLQEVDRASDRSYQINERDYFADAFADAYASAYALNFYVLFVPYPMPPIGMVTSGIQTLSKVQPESAMRVSLPCPFPWPIRTANLKRCLLVERIPIANSDAELVLINLHLEAFDEGEGKDAQTRQLVDFMKGEYEKGNYVIAGGDFNQLFSNIDTSAYPNRGEKYWQPGYIDITSFGEGFEAIMDSSVPSCRSLDRPYDGAEDFQLYLIDGFIISKNVRFDSVQTIDTGFEHSDHNPVCLQVSLN